MKRACLIAFSGLLFGFGLCISQMVNPEKVLAFLDISGSWDPSLAFVMIGGLGVAAFGVARVSTWPKPFFATGFSLPQRSRIDRPLIAGAVIFGVGWGLVGFCPGPAIASLAYGLAKSWLFLAAMIAGMVSVRLVMGPRSLQPTQQR